MTPTSRRRSLLLPLVITIGLTAAWATAPPSNADDDAANPAAKRVSVVTGSSNDPDDTIGPLDIARVTDRTVEVAPEHFQLTYRVVTFDAFESSRLDLDERNFVIELNRDGESGSERNVRISTQNGRLVAEVISNASREVIATVNVTRPSDHAVQISGPRRLLGARSYFWTSDFHADRSPVCGYSEGWPVFCQDSVPQQGWLRMQSPAWPDLDE
jgi:hypothetical protein